MKTITDLTFAPAGPRDTVAMAELLRAAELPAEDLLPPLDHFLVARDQSGTVIGAIGAEVRAPDALLRSLVVTPVWQGAGLGGELVRRLEAAAGAWGVERWWLLTTTAEVFFARLGFAVSERATAPAAIRQTGQFQGGICRSAVCMTRARRSS